MRTRYHRPRFHSGTGYGAQSPKLHHTQKDDSKHLPLPSGIRTAKIIGLFDINNPAEWGEYVLDFIAESFPDLPRPDAYYAGSSYDAHWFRECFQNIELEDRTDPDFPFVTGTMVRDMIKFGDARWKNFIAPENHHLIEEYFNKKKGII